MATKERGEIKGTTKQKMARRLNREGGNYLEQKQVKICGQISNDLMLCQNSTIKGERAISLAHTVKYKLKYSVPNITGMVVRSLLEPGPPSLF